MADPQRQDDPALLRVFLDAVPDMLMLGRYDEESWEMRIIAVNKTTCLVTGFSEEELIGTLPRDLMDGAAGSPTLEMRRAMGKAARAQGVVEYPIEVRLRTPENGPRLRIRLIWPDPADTLVLIQIEVLKD